MSAFVLDSSVAAAWCFPDERTDFTNGMLQTISAPVEAIAPRLWAYEVRNSVLMGLRRKRITPLPYGCPQSDPVSYDGVFSLAERHGLTVYDAAYLDLAIREGLPLASLDKALCKAALRSNVALFQP